MQRGPASFPRRDVRSMAVSMAVDPPGRLRHDSARAPSSTAEQVTLKSLDANAVLRAWDTERNVLSYTLDPEARKQPSVPSDAAGMPDFDPSTSVLPPG